MSEKLGRPGQYDDVHVIADITVGELARLVCAIHRARTILANMAEENPNAGVFASRWPISHEPLRADARNLLPELNEILRIHT
jgi:hypothetical protein